ncbi:MAG: hypothetical protein ACE5KM_21175 [Planctomycetaceae bacterium]
MLLLVVLALLVGCLQESQLATSPTANAITSSELSAKLQSVENELCPPPQNWKSKLNQKITFVGVRTGGKGASFRVGNSDLDVRGAEIESTQYNSPVRVTGILRVVYHPGDPTYLGQQGHDQSRPWAEYFIDAITVEALEE